ncbi:hypothetical protein VCHA53O466_40175 [Vibrio chagasii]|nr:hypothetical protein VCHA53O466_40175 [Vibrio chagasii]
MNPNIKQPEKTQEVSSQKLLALYAIDSRKDSLVSDEHLLSLVAAFEQAQTSKFARRGTINTKSLQELKITGQMVRPLVDATHSLFNQNKNPFLAVAFKNERDRIAVALGMEAPKSKKPSSKIESQTQFTSPAQSKSLAKTKPAKKGHQRGNITHSGKKVTSKSASAKELRKSNKDIANDVLREFAISREKASLFVNDLVKGKSNNDRRFSAQVDEIVKDLSARLNEQDVDWGTLQLAIDKKGCEDGLCQSVRDTMRRLVNLMDASGLCWRSINGFVEEFGVSKSTIIRHFNLFEKMGYIFRIRGDASRRISTAYILNRSMFVGEDYKHKVAVATCPELEGADCKGSLLAKLDLSGNKLEPEMTIVDVEEHKTTSLSVLDYHNDKVDKRVTVPNTPKTLTCFAEKSEIYGYKHDFTFTSESGEDKTVYFRNIIESALMRDFVDMYGASTVESLIIEIDSRTKVAEVLNARKALVSSHANEVIMQTILKPADYFTRIASMVNKYNTRSNNIKAIEAKLRAEKRAAKEARKLERQNKTEKGLK